jgi:nucleoside-diphosphate-sugar epimerase
MKALVIGGSGVVGAAVAERLQQDGIEVVCLSRRGDALLGRAIIGDVRVADLGLSAHELAEVRDELTHIVSCFGSVDWRSGPGEALETHRDGTLNVIQFAQSCPRLERIVHVSSVLVFGRTERIVGNRDLDVGQSFRNWYEYGKFMAECAVRQYCEVPWRVVRLGPVLGVQGPVAPSATGGLPSALPFLLRGYPVHVERGGAFPCYVGESRTAAAVIAHACRRDGMADTWTWYDPRLPTLAQVLTSLCAPWGVIPRLVCSKSIGSVGWLLAPRLGLPRVLLAYARRWVRLDQMVLDDLPSDLPECPPDYCEATGELLKRSVPAMVA